MRLTTGKHVVDWVANELRSSFGEAVGIGMQKWDRVHKVWKLCGGVVYESYNGVNVVCHVASDGSKRWMNREFLWAIFDYPFNVQKVSRITVPIAVSNKDSIKFVENLGFTFETLLKDAHPSGNLLFFVARKPCAERWLNLKVRQWTGRGFEKHLDKAA